MIGQRYFNMTADSPLWALITRAYGAVLISSIRLVAASAKQLEGLQMPLAQETFCKCQKTLAPGTSLPSFRAGGSATGLSVTDAYRAIVGNVISIRPITIASDS